MSDQPAYAGETAQPSNTPVIALVIVIALWYAWGLGLVLISVLG